MKLCKICQKEYNMENEDFPSLCPDCILSLAYEESRESEGFEDLQ